MESRFVGREGVFAVLFFLGALLLATALLLPAWRWVMALAQAGFISSRLMFLGVGLYALTWLVPVILILNRARREEQVV